MQKIEGRIRDCARYFARRELIGCFEPLKSVLDSAEVRGVPFYAYKATILFSVAYFAKTAASASSSAAHARLVSILPDRLRTLNF